MIRDAWASRGERIPRKGASRFYRDTSDIFGRGLGGADAETIKRHTESGMRPEDTV